MQQRERDVQHLLDDLTRLRDSLCADRSSLSEQRNILSAEKVPVNWLPSEILMHIFILHSESLLDEANQEVKPVSLYHMPPVTLSHVSTKWRSICLSTSRLWSCISHSSTDFCQEAVTTFLQRAKNHPLSLLLRPPPRDIHSRQKPDNAASHVIADLRPYFSRLASVVFRCEKAIAIEEVVGIINDHTCDLSGLRRLALAIETSNPYFHPS